MNIRWFFPMAAALLLASSPTRAGQAWTAGGATGQGYRGFHVRVDGDIPTPTFGVESDNPEERWSGGVGYAYTQADNATASRIGEISVGIRRVVRDWSVDVSFLAGRDEISSLQRIGPTIGFAYAWTDGASPEDHILDVSGNFDLFAYSPDTVLSTRTISVHSAPVTVPAHKGRVTTAQFHPELTLSKPLFHGRLAPAITVGAYAYSSDPSPIEALIGRPHLSASPDVLGGRIGGFLRENGLASLHLRLSDRSALEAEIGAAKLFTINEWVVVQGARLTVRAEEHLGLSTRWERTLQEGVRQDVVAGDLTFRF